MKIYNKSNYIRLTVGYKNYLPGKIRIHLWRIFNNYLSIFYNLKQRKLKGDVNCVICGLEAETVQHLFRDCQITNQVIQLLDVDISHANRNQEWKFWLAEMVVCNNTSQNMSPSILCWSI